MAKQKSVRVNVIPFRAKSPEAAPANVQSPEHGSEHGWLVPHLIMLITYAERHNLGAVENALAIAAESIVQATRAPIARTGLSGHRDSAAKPDEGRAKPARRSAPAAGSASGGKVVPVATNPTVRSG